MSDTVPTLAAVLAMAEVYGVEFAQNFPDQDSALLGIVKWLAERGFAAVNFDPWVMVNEHGEHVAWLHDATTFEQAVLCAAARELAPSLSPVPDTAIEGGPEGGGGK